MIADILTGLSLAAVVVIGYVSIRLGRRSTVASERAARASEESAQASVKASDATERAVAASEKAAALAARDARIRGLESLLEIVLEMRERFNDYYNATGSTTPDLGSPERLARIALGRKLEARLTPFEDEFPTAGSPPSAIATEKAIRTLRESMNWSNTLLENVIFDIQDRIRNSQV